MSELLEAYWSPIYAMLRRSGLAREDAADLTQSFITERMLDGELLDRADPGRGRFRGLLQRAVRNHMIDHLRREQAMARRQAAWTPEMLDAAEPCEGDDPATAFDRQYASAMLGRALELLEAECAASDMGAQWTVFDERVVRKVRGGLATPVSELAERLNARSSQVIFSMNQTMNRKFEAVFDQVIAQTVESPEEVADEKRRILEIMGVNGESGG